jgi:Ca2+/Na+ antiporter
MSFSDHAVVWLHIVAAVFTVGPGTAAIMATPRYIRKRDVVVLGYLNRATEIYAIGSLLVLVFGLIAAQLLHDFSKPWISASITLYVVAAVLLVLIMRDQRKAMTAVAAAGPVADATGRSDYPNETDADPEAADGDRPDGTRAQAETKTAMVEQGRIAMMSGIVALIWLAILVLMVWGAS